MAVESVEEKAVRLLADGRLTITHRDLGGGIAAVCRGDHGSYELIYNPAQRRWRCSCPELKGRCSHLAAARLVT